MRDIIPLIVKIVVRILASIFILIPVTVICFSLRTEVKQSHGIFIDHYSLAQVIVNAHNGEHVLSILGGPSSVPLLSNGLVWLYFLEKKTHSPVFNFKIIKQESIRIIFDESWKVLRIEIINK